MFIRFDLYEDGKLIRKFGKYGVRIEDTNFTKILYLDYKNGVFYNLLLDEIILIYENDQFFIKNVFRYIIFCEINSFIVQFISLEDNLTEADYFYSLNVFGKYNKIRDKIKKEIDKYLILC